jgi:hypothetical protein
VFNVTAAKAEAADLAKRSNMVLVVPTERSNGLLVNSEGEGVRKADS